MSESRDRADQPADQQPEQQADQQPEQQPEQQADQQDPEEVERERRERLDPENRPEEAEVDNTDREFDEEKGMFTDSEGYEQAEERFPPMGEQGA